MGDIFDVDRYYIAGLRGDEINVTTVDEVCLLAYNAGRTAAGRETYDSIDVSTRNGAVSLLESEHPANFRADA